MEQYIGYDPKTNKHIVLDSQEVQLLSLEEIDSESPASAAIADYNASCNSRRFSDKVDVAKNEAELRSVASSLPSIWKLVRENYSSDEDMIRVLTL